jgi:uncharacterized protein
MIIALWIAVALIVAMAVFSARLIVRPGRSRIWSTPAELGLPFEDVEFRTPDGVRLVAWFIPAPANAQRPAPVIMTLHGWPWCRMGTQAKSLLNDLPFSRPVHLLPLLKRLHDEGYHVLAPDLRNFGDSESRGVVTGGWLESRDVLGMLDWLRGRPDVDMGRVGAIGFSQGAATLMYAAAQADQIRAVVAVQPTTASVFAKGYARSLMGPLAPIVKPLTLLLYQIAGGPAQSFIDPALAMIGVRTPFLYIQGTGDRWGSQADVARMASLTKNGTAMYPETTHRFEGYTWVLTHPDVTMSFLRTHVLGTPAPTA